MNNFRRQTIDNELNYFLTDLINKSKTIGELKEKNKLSSSITKEKQISIIEIQIHNIKYKIQKLINIKNNNDNC